METAYIISIVIASVQMIFNLLMGLFMFGLRRKFSETDDLRKKVEQREETIRTQVKKEVDARLGAMEQAVNKLIDRDHQAELQLKDEVHSLRLYVTQYCATKSGMNDLGNKVTALREHVIRNEQKGGV